VSAMRETARNMGNEPSVTVFVSRDSERIIVCANATPEKSVYIVLNWK